jgi:hypothetical protein
MPETGEATQVLKLGILDQSGRPGQPAAGGGTVGQVLLSHHNDIARPNIASGPSPNASAPQTGS